MAKIKHLEQKFSIARYELIKECEPLELKFYLWIKLWAINKHEAWPGYRTISAELNISQSTVRDLVLRMETSGRLKVDRHRGISSVYNFEWYDNLVNNEVTEGQTFISRAGEKEYLKKLVAAQDNKCAYCLLPMWAVGSTHKTGDPNPESGWPTLDHILPTTRGGGNNTNNLVAACSKCNAKKGTKMIMPKITALKVEAPTALKVEAPTALKVEAKLEEIKREEIKRVPEQGSEWRWEPIKGKLKTGDRVSQLIGLMWELQNQKFDNKEQYAAQFKRHLRDARALDGYEQKKVEAVMHRIAKGEFDFLTGTWGLRTVLKLIDRPVETGKGQQIRFVDLNKKQSVKA